MLVQTKSSSLNQYTVIVAGASEWFFKRGAIQIFYYIASHWSIIRRVAGVSMLSQSSVFVIDLGSDEWTEEWVDLSPRAGGCRFDDDSCWVRRRADTQCYSSGFLKILNVFIYDVINTWEVNFCPLKQLLLFDFCINMMLTFLHFHLGSRNEGRCTDWNLLYSIK